MNFKFINPQNVSWLVPSWIIEPFQLAALLEDMVANCPYPMMPKNDQARITYSARAIITDGKIRSEFLYPSDQHKGYTGTLYIKGVDADLVLPIRPMLKGSEALKDTNCLYYHAFHDAGELGYHGITKQRWFDRYAQHRSDSQRESPYLFHRALRQKEGVRLFHRVLVAGLARSEVMQLEEESVAAYSLHPVGLNMIPGGEAGFRYLASLGIAMPDAEWRDRVMVSLMSRPSLAGRPNPLCAARWENDQDFVNRLVCGHSGRFTLQDVRDFRAMASKGMSAEALSDLFGYSISRIKNLIAGKTYSRVA